MVYVVCRNKRTGLSNANQAFVPGSVKVNKTKNNGGGAQRVRGIKGRSGAAGVCNARRFVKRGVAAVYGAQRCIPNKRVGSGGDQVWGRCHVRGKWGMKVAG